MRPFHAILRTSGSLLGGAVSDFAAASLAAVRELMRDSDREWFDALRAEVHAIEGAWDRFLWRLSTARFVLASIALRLATLLPLWLCAALAGLVLARLALELEDGHYLYLASIGLLIGVLALVRSRWPWRWALLVGVWLPIFVYATDLQGPYSNAVAPDSDGAQPLFWYIPDLNTLTPEGAAEFIRQAKQRPEPAIPSGFYATYDRFGPVDSLQAPLIALLVALVAGWMRRSWDARLRRLSR